MDRNAGPSGRQNGGERTIIAGVIAVVFMAVGTLAMSMAGIMCAVPLLSRLPVDRGCPGAPDQGAGH